MIVAWTCAACALGFGLFGALPACAETVEGPDLWVIAPDDAVDQAVVVRDAFPIVLRRAEEWLGMPTEAHVIIELVESHEQMEERVGTRLPAGTVGACRPPSLIGIRLDLVRSADDGALKLILAHETIHHVLSRLPHPRLPRWFEEGLATFFTGCRGTLLLRWIRASGGPQAVQLPTFSHFDEWQASDDSAGFELDYLVGASAVDFFLERYDAQGLRRLLDRLREGKPFDASFEALTGLTPEAFEAQWRRSLSANDTSVGSRVVGVSAASLALLLLLIELLVRMGRRDRLGSVRGPASVDPAEPGHRERGRPYATAGD